MQCSAWQTWRGQAQAELGKKGRWGKHEGSGKAPGTCSAQPHPEVVIYTAHLDRGLSPPEVLKAALGLYAERERGLNDVQYVVPGAGGLGELLTNSWV
jgi:hypothetical protein